MDCDCARLPVLACGAMTSSMLRSSLPVLTHSVGLWLLGIPSRTSGLAQPMKFPIGSVELCDSLFIALFRSSVRLCSTMVKKLRELSNVDVDRIGSRLRGYGGCLSKDQLPRTLPPKFFVVNMQDSTKGNGTSVFKLHLPPTLTLSHHGAFHACHRAWFRAFPRFDFGTSS